MSAAVDFGSSIWNRLLATDWAKPLRRALEAALHTVWEGDFDNHEATARLKLRDDRRVHFGHITTAVNDGYEAFIQDYLRAQRDGATNLPVSEIDLPSSVPHCVLEHLMKQMRMDRPRQESYKTWGDSWEGRKLLFFYLNGCWEENDGSIARSEEECKAEPVDPVIIPTVVDTTSASEEKQHEAAESVTIIKYPCDQNDWNTRGKSHNYFRKVFFRDVYEKRVIRGIRFDLEDVREVYAATRASYNKEVQIARERAKMMTKTIQNRITDVMMCPETVHAKEDFTTGSSLYKLWWGDHIRNSRTTPADVELPSDFCLTMTPARLNECENFWVKHVAMWQAKASSKGSKRERGGGGGGSGSTTHPSSASPSKRPRPRSPSPSNRSRSPSPAQNGNAGVASSESVLLAALDAQTEKITNAMEANATQMADALRAGLQAIADSLKE